MAPTSRIQALRDTGTSIWLDSLSRDMLEDGHFQALIDGLGVTGATSNPTIFAKAIRGSTHYDEQVRALSAAGTTDLRELFFAVALDDVRAAAAQLSSVYSATGGADGFVSFECTPDIADDTEATVTQALELWDRLARPNVMIKVPATPAGVPAIEQLTSLGVNVNVTLLFSVERYEAVADAYLRGLARRVQDRLPIGDIASAASFFLSRIDHVADDRLPADSPLRGRLAIASAQHAYGRFLAKFSGPEWERLQALGARVQRPLWASTAPKDPSFPDTLYVDALAGPDVIATLPEKTLLAAADHGEPQGTLATAEPAALEVLRAAESSPVDLAAVAEQLERDGVQAFCDSYDELAACLRAKRDALAGQAA